MKKVYILLGLLVTLYSCGRKEAPPIINPHNEGIVELRRYESKIESFTDEKLPIFPYSNGPVYRVFELHCPGECFLAEFKNRIARGIEIPKKDFHELLTLLNDPHSYDNSTAACYYPEFGLVVYDENDIPTESLSICLDCNNFLTDPGRVKITYNDKAKRGFSKAAREKLRQMFFRWGIDYYGYLPFWDDECEYDKYLESKRLKDTIER